MTFPSDRWQSIPDRRHSIALLIAVVTLLRLLLAATVPLLPQEAYYWTWSRHLDWSYFDHPPLATYSIALTTALFGTTSFGIKAAAVVWALGWNLLWARLILDMYGDRRLVFWSLAALNLTLLYEAYALAPTPDAPLLFAWVGTIWAVWRASQSGDGRWWLAAGVFLGLAWLGKYTGILLVPVVFLYLLTSPTQRHWLLKPQPYVAAALAVIVFGPVLYWNSQHEWISLAFQSSRRVGSMSGFKPRYFLLLIGTQFLMMTPYLFVIAIAALVRGARGWWARSSDDRTRLLLLNAAVPIVLFTLISFRSIIKINWLVPAFWSLVILGVHHLLAREHGFRNLARGLASSAAILVACGLVLAIPNLPIADDMNSWSGWKEAAARVDRVQQSEQAAGRESFVFSPNYKISSLLRFYLPGQPRTYAQDVYAEKALQFDYFPLDRDLKGATGILVVSDQGQSNLDREKLKPYFDACQLADSVEASALGKVTRRVEIFRCPNYAGHPPRAAAQGAQPD